MTHTPEKTEPRWAELSDDVLESVEASRKQAIDAIRKFVDEVGGEDREVAAQERHRRRLEPELRSRTDGRIEFFRSVARSAGQAVGNSRNGPNHRRPMAGAVAFEGARGHWSFAIRRATAYAHRS